MTIQGTGMIAAFQQSSYFSSSNLSSQSNKTEQQKGLGGPGGAKGKGGPGGPPPKGPNLDIDKDGLWSSSEIDDFSAAMGLELNANEIISTYDTNADGGIDSSEREALGKDNALQLPRPEQLMQMRSEILGTQNEDSVKQSTSHMFSQVMEAYVNSTKYQEDILSILDVAL